MKNIAFVFTEYQQNILFAICLQKNTHIDILFIRKNIALHHNVNKFTGKIIYFKDTPFSWRSVWKYYRVYRETIHPVLDNKEDYLVFTWSLDNPIVKHTINSFKTTTIHLFEDGSGSYVRWGFYNYNLGFKTFIVSSFIFLSTNLLSFRFRPLNRSSIKGYSLFDNSFPDLNIEKELITHQNFQKIIENSVAKCGDIFEFNNESIVFITSPYVEFGILNENEYIEVIIKSIEKIYQKNKVVKKVYWKVHPRTNVENEKSRLRSVEETTNIDFEIVYADFNIELIAFANRQNKIQYYSLGSTSLYVIKALVSDDSEVYLLESELLKGKLTTQFQLSQLYKSIGVKII